MLNLEDLRFLESHFLTFQTYRILYLLVFKPQIYAIILYYYVNICMTVHPNKIVLETVAIA